MKDKGIQLFNSNIVAKAKKIDWYWLETWKQIAKDFEIEALLQYDTIEQEDQFTAISNLLKPIIIEFLETRIEYFFSILYKIDISENQIKALLPLDKSETALGDLTRIIVEREFLKVLTRDYIKNQKLRSNV